MRKVKKIMDIPEQMIQTIDNTAVSIDICNIRHSPVHYHESAIEMILCLDGQINILCNHEVITLTKGKMFTIGFDDLHCLYSDTDNLLICMHLDMKQIDMANISWETLKYTYFACEDSSCEAYQKAPIRKIKNYILAAAYTYVKTSELPGNISKEISENIINLLMEYFDWFNHINLSPNNNNELRQRFRTVMKYCVENHTNKLTISQIADAVHINENYFSQFIHKSGYRSFNNLVGYIRCFKAQYLLLNSELSVIQISDKCGFSDVKYFYKHFRIAWQKTPKEFRQWFIDYMKSPNYIYHYTNAEVLYKLEPFVAEYFIQSILS